jgi:hypothetical protein
MPSLGTLKLIGGLVALLLLAALVADRGRWMHRAHNAEAQLAAICTATRAAANQPKLDCKQTAQQITFMGEAVQALSNSLKVQNAAVSALGEQTKAQQAEAAKASRNAEKRAQEAQGVSDRLIASSRSAGAPCKASPEAERQWQ